jgi:hypothetical protein
VLDDLLALPPDPPVLAEGFNLPPRLVAPLLCRPRQAVWLLPSTISSLPHHAPGPSSLP